METGDILLELLEHESHLSAGKESIINWAERHFATLGLSTRIVRENCDPALVAVFGEPEIYLNGHLDVVPPGTGWTRKAGETDGDIIYGRGVLDMKGPCAALISAAECLKEQGVPVGVILTTDEETTMNGARAVTGQWQGPAPRFLLVCEPTGFASMTEEKGALHFTVRAQGRSAHGSMPERGKNAIDALIEIYGSIRQDVSGMTGVTVNLGRISGGEKVNMVAQDAEMELDVRFPAPIGREDLEGSLFRHSPSNGAAVEYAVDQYLGPWKAERTLFHDIVDDLAGGKRYTAPYATEAVVFQHLCPCAVFGPGDPSGAHEKDESVGLSDLERAREMYVSLVRSCAKPPGRGS